MTSPTRKFAVATGRVMTSEPTGATRPMLGVDIDCARQPERAANTGVPTISASTRAIDPRTTR